MYILDAAVSAGHALPMPDINTLSAACDHMLHMNGNCTLSIMHLLSTNSGNGSECDALSHLPSHSSANWHRMQYDTEDKQYIHSSVVRLHGFSFLSAPEGKSATNV